MSKPQVEALCKQSERRVAAYRADVAALPAALAALAKRTSAAAADVRQLLIAGQVWTRGFCDRSTEPSHMHMLTPCSRRCCWPAALQMRGGPGMGAILGCHLGTIPAAQLKPPCPLCCSALLMPSPPPPLPQSRSSIYQELEAALDQLLRSGKEQPLDPLALQVGRTRARPHPPPASPTPEELEHEQHSEGAAQRQVPGHAVAAARVAAQLPTHSASTASSRMSPPLLAVQGEVIMLRAMLRERDAQLAEAQEGWVAPAPSVVCAMSAEVLECGDC